MASGKFQSNFIEYMDGTEYALIVEWTSTPDISTASSVVTATVKLKFPYNLYISARTNNKVTINGVSYYFNSPAINVDTPNFDYVGSPNFYTTVTLGKVTSNPIAHLSDGSGVANITAAFKLNATISDDYYGTVSAKKSVSLDSLPVKAKITGKNFTDETNPSFTYVNQSGDSVEELAVALSLDGTNTLTAYKTVDKNGNSGELTLTSSEKQTLLNSVSGTNSRTIYYIIRTKISGTYLTHTSPSTFTIVDGMPIINPIILDGDSEMVALTEDNSKFVKFYSDLSYTINASGTKGATITSVSATYAGKTLNTNTGVFRNVEGNKIVFTATDNRGNTTRSEATINLIEYVKLTCNLKASNPTATGEMNITIEGNYFNGMLGVEQNQLGVQFRLKEGNGEYSDWQTLGSTTVTNNTYSVSFNINQLDYRSTYTIQARALDKVEFTGRIETPEIKVKTIPVFDWGEEDFNLNCDLKINGNTVLRATDEKRVVLSSEGANIHIRPNGSTTDDGQMVLAPNGHLTVNGGLYVVDDAILDGSVIVGGEMDVAGAVNVQGALSVKGSPLADYIIGQGSEPMGTNGVWYWTKWNSGKAECYGTRNYGNMAVTTAWGSMYVSDDFNQSLPSGLFAAAPDFISITPQSGGYGTWVSKGYEDNPTATTTGTFCLVRGKSNTLSQAKLAFLVIGRWK